MSVLCTATFSRESAAASNNLPALSPPALNHTADIFQDEGWKSFHADAPPPIYKVAWDVCQHDSVCTLVETFSLFQYFTLLIWPKEKITSNKYTIKVGCCLDLKSTSDPHSCSVYYWSMRLPCARLHISTTLKMHEKASLWINQSTRFLCHTKPLGDRSKRWAVTVKRARMGVGSGLKFVLYTR